MKDAGLLILRIGMGGLMIPHGWKKLQKLLDGGEIKFADPFGIGPTASLVLVIFAELLCSALVVVGIRVKLTAIPVIFTMIIAAFIQHAGDPLKDRELALVYLFGFSAIALLGSGKYSLDKYLKFR